MARPRQVEIREGGGNARQWRNWHGGTRSTPDDFASGKIAWTVFAGLSGGWKSAWLWCTITKSKRGSRKLFITVAKVS